MCCWLRVDRADGNDDEIGTKDDVKKNADAILGMEGSISTLHDFLSNQRALMVRLFTLRLILQLLRIHQIRVQVRGEIYTRIRPF